jgi:MFS family permease
MDLSTTFENINWLSVIVAALSSFALGAIWYGPFFGKAWMKVNGFKEEDLKGQNFIRIYGLAFLLMLIASLVLEMFIGNDADLVFGIMAGFFAGIGWVATMMGVMYLFELETRKKYLINAGYSVFALIIMGAILGAW